MTQNLFESELSSLLIDSNRPALIVWASWEIFVWGHTYLEIEQTWRFTNYLENHCQRYEHQQSI